MGYEDAALAGGGSDEVIDACFVWGDESAIRTRIQNHLDAGADHVSVSVLSPDLESSADRFERLAPALL
ncbi:hypothetical protein E1281_30145 [Actinomadura sp. KC345]|uniref:hypothetical protein n=1 Tax=Actinomadura sp. KC345 TaxID=2530371 RepID=UPI00105155B7|nr:hypothetical protein [Actinomadura sp. KC345]TDC45495.1 hypothetical protein E1281_30145 [Actinomadura sp. KC345]